MASKRKKIATKNLPTRFPIWFFIVIFMILERVNTPEWAWGMFWTLVVITLFSIIIASRNHEFVDIFKSSDDIAYELFIGTGKGKPK